MKRFESPDLNFLYPANWTVIADADDADGEAPDEVTLQSPNSAQLTIAIYQPFDDTEDLQRRAVDALKAEYEDLEIEEAKEEIRELTLSGVNLSFFYLDLLVISEIRVVERAEDKLLLMIQSESRELEENRDVFQAIIYSLLKPEVMDMDSAIEKGNVN